MTSKELLYIEDALTHEQLMKTCCSNVQLQDTTLMNYMKELEKKHCELCSKLLNLL